MTYNNIVIINDCESCEMLYIRTRAVYRRYFSVSPANNNKLLLLSFGRKNGDALCVRPRTIIHEIVEKKKKKVGYHNNVTRRLADKSGLN